MVFHRLNRCTSLLLSLALSFHVIQTTTVVLAFSSRHNNPTSTIPPLSHSSLRNSNDEDPEIRTGLRPSTLTLTSSVASQEWLSGSHPSRPTAVPPNHRRQFMAGLAGTLVAAVTGGTARPANAVETTLGVGGVKISKRAGGLAQKIRVGVCFKMVRIVRQSRLTTGGTGHCPPVVVNSHGLRLLGLLPPPRVG
jgi:hypothetical protein